MSANSGGRRRGQAILPKDPMTNREIDGKPAEKHLFITNGRNLELPMH